MAHHNSLGIRHQLTIRHLYRTFFFWGGGGIQCIYMRTGSLSAVLVDFVGRRALYEGKLYLR